MAEKAEETRKEVQPVEALSVGEDIGTDQNPIIQEEKQTKVIKFKQEKEERKKESINKKK